MTLKKYAFIIFFAGMFLGSCSTSQKISNIPESIDDVDEKVYVKTLMDNTRSARKYEGFYQLFQVHVTRLTSEVQNMVIQRKGYYYQWSRQQYLQEKQNDMKLRSTDAQFFLQFFTPDIIYDDLNKPKTIWRLYLDWNGQRFEGTVKKVLAKPIEIQSLYPSFDRFSTPYMVTFQVPMNVIEQGTARVLLTSSIGQAEFNF